MHHTQDLVDDYEDEMAASYEPDVDPVSAGVGGEGYVARYTLDACQERFDESRVARFPETFDRFYFDTPHGRILVDLLADGTPEQLERERDRKRVVFKTEWCEANGWRYLPLAESDVSAEKIRMLLAREPGSEPRVSAPAPRKTAAKRGQIQRPKATA